MHFCTVDLVKLMREVDQIMKIPVELEGREAEIDNQMEDILELKKDRVEITRSYDLDPLYGNRGKLRYDAWVDQSVTSPTPSGETTRCIANIWYNPQNIRMLVFHRAAIEVLEKKDVGDFACRGQILVDLDTTLIASIGERSAAYSLDRGLWVKLHTLVLHRRLSCDR